MAISPSNRARIASQFEIWCKENKYILCAQAMMAFLCQIDVLDETKVDRYLRALRKENRSYTGMKKFQPNGKGK